MRGAAGRWSRSAVLLLVTAVLLVPVAVPFWRAYGPEARGGGHDSPAVKALRAMPVATYRNISEIRSSVDLPPSETPE